jgi:hypothetical protein
MMCIVSGGVALSGLVRPPVAEGSEHGNDISGFKYAGNVTIIWSRRTLLLGLMS